MEYAREPVDAVGMPPLSEGRERRSLFAASHHRQSETGPGDSRLAGQVRGGDRRFEEILKLPVKEVLHRLFHEDDLRLFESEPMCFRCNCSRERIESVLISLGQEEVNSIVKEKGKVEINCEFCNAHYELDKIDVEALFTESTQPSTPETRH